MSQLQGVTGARGRAGFIQGMSWVTCGWQHVQRDVPLWLCMSALYLVGATLLGHIPFAGLLLIVLLSPMVLAGALLALHHGAEAAANAGLALRAARQLGRAFANEAHAFAAVLLGILTLGLVVIVGILEHLVGVGSLNSLLAATLQQTLPLSSLLLGVVVAGSLTVLLLMALFFAVHRTILARRDPMVAIADSFGATRRHALALIAFVSAHAIAGVIIALGFRLSPIAGYLLLYTLGLVALPVFVAGSYCGYREAFDA